MGQTSGKLYDATTQKTWMGIQRAYTEVTMAKVDFSQPTGNESDEDDDEKEEEAGGQRRTVEEDVRFESYKPSKLKVEGMRPHPSDAVENGTLATAAALTVDATRKTARCARSASAKPPTNGGAKKPTIRKSISSAADAVVEKPHSSNHSI